MNRWILTLAAVLMICTARAADELPAMFIYAEPDLPGPMVLALLADEVVAATPWVMAAASTTALGADIGIPVTIALPSASPAVALVPVAGGGAAVMVDPVRVKEDGFWATIKKNPGKSFLALAGIARIVYDNRVKMGLSSPDGTVGGAGSSTSTSSEQEGDNDGVNIEISDNSGAVSVTIIKGSPSADVDDKQATGSQPRFESDNTSSSE